MLIGATDEKDGFYFFRGMDVVAVMKNSDTLSSDMWYRRLGHQSSRALNLLHIFGFSSSSDFDSKSCEIYIRVKQTKVVFLTSLNKITSIFQLIHCDIWGSY